MKLSKFAAIAVLSTFATTAVAHEYKLGDLVIDHPMTFETAPTAMAGGGYLTITNNGASDDRLIAVRADFPRVMLHTTEMQDDVARMMHIDAVDVPSGETVMLAPGGMHVMFMGLNGDPFEVGEEIPATLIFEQAGEIDVIFNVEKRDGEGMDHSMHQADG